MKSISSSTKWRVVVDTNIFVSAFLHGGIPHKVIKLWWQETITLLMSPFLLSEIIFTLQRFGLDPQNLQNLTTSLELYTRKFSPPQQAFLCRDPKDNRILDLCQVGKADILITGDKDLLTLKQFRGTQIVSPRQFLTLVKAQN